MDESPRPGGSATWSLAIVTVLVLILAALVVPLAWHAAAPTRWEYVIVSAPDENLEQELKKWGDLGWEVASARRAISKSYGSESEGVYEFVMKRKK